MKSKSRDSKNYNHDLTAPDLGIRKISWAICGTVLFGKIFSVGIENFK